MALEIKVPSPGESITEAEIADWFFNSGDFVEKDQEIGEIESEKATLPLIAEESGKLVILKNVGDTVNVGEVVCTIDTSAKGEAGKSVSPKKEEKEKKNINDKAGESKQEKSKESGIESEKGSQQGPKAKSSVSPQEKDTDTSRVKMTPVAKKMAEENHLNIDDIIKGLKKISSKEMNTLLEKGSVETAYSPIQKKEATRDEEKNKMSQLRRKLAKRLVSVKNETAMLTTFNEADMSNIMNLRRKYQKDFMETHGIKLGFMSFFAKAVTKTLMAFPNVNSRIEGEELITPQYYDIGIAVQTDKGLMVPVLRNTEMMGLADIEKEIMELAGRARKGRLSIEEMSGGTFTITNGGIFGSMLSTPILNPPQSAILGMHNIIDRPVAVNGKVEIRPMMYIALSYDHRIVDGKDSVSFLVKVKELIENPENMLFGPQDPEKILLGL